MCVFPKPYDIFQNMKYVAKVNEFLSFEGKNRWHSKKME